MNTVPALHVIGYAVEETEADGYIGLCLVFRGEDGLPIDAKRIELRRWTDTPDNHAVRARLAYLAEAICRHLNSGGSLEDLEYTKAAFSQLPVVTLPATWKLWDIRYDEYTLVDNTNAKAPVYLRVVDGLYTEEFSAPEFYETQIGRKPPIELDADEKDG